ncbi:MULTISPECIES: hypothetical protein [Frankia]|uniref:hypothetical protein n=1 Tax=Frankia TaxID=1854 RepID=UPI0021C1CAF9|nr:MULTISPECIES: hypothetical protein [Frankia]
MTPQGYLIEEAVVRTVPDRPARVLRVTRDGRDVDHYASWADLIVAFDVHRMVEVE